MRDTFNRGWCLGRELCWGDTTMPPKKDIASVVFLKFKRQATTYFVEVSKKDNAGQFRKALVDAINQSGGLQINDKPVPIEQELDMQVEVPKIGLNDSSDSESDNEKNDNVVNDDGEDYEIKSDVTDVTPSGRVMVTEDEITLGKIQDQTQMYNTSITDIEDLKTTVESLQLTDFSVLAFRFKDEQYQLYQPQD